MGKHLVFVGGGHAHMLALLRLGDYVERGHRVTLVSPSTHHYYSGMGPGLLSGIYRPQQVRFHVRKMAEDRGAAFVQDEVARVDAARRVLHLASGGEVPYDVVSFNTGSKVPTEGLLAEPDERVFPVKPIVNLVKAQRLVLDALRGGSARVVVIGGGPSGVEMSANLWRLARERGGRATITLVAGSKILGGFPSRVRAQALASLSRRGIAVREGQRVDALRDGVAALADGTTLPYDAAFVAAGVRPSPIFRESGLPTADDGGLLVNACLQSVAHPEMFGGGDCISIESQRLARVGVYAVRQNPVLHGNLLAALEGGEMASFDPGGAYLVVLNMGDGTGILHKKWLGWHGRLAFRLKDFIDRRFMRKFQVSGELGEPEGIDTQEARHGNP